MQYIHIKNLEEYHPGYKDRDLIWCKAYFKMLNADPEFEMLGEIDKWRFLAFVMLELQVKKPIPLDEAYLIRKGFDFKKRSLMLTVKAIDKSTEIFNDLMKPIEINNVTVEKDERNESVTQRREEKRREEKNIEAAHSLKILFLEFVYLTQCQYDQLAEKLGKTVLDEYVERLNNYIGAKGTKYKSHYHVILNWKAKDGGIKSSASKPVDNRDLWEKNANKNCVNCRGTGSIYAPGSGKYSKCGCVRL